MSHSSPAKNKIGFRLGGSAELLNTALIPLAVFVFMLIFNIMTPLIADDFNYSFSWATNRRVTCVADIISSMQTHRLFQHCRVVASGFASLFLLLPKGFFNVFNALSAALTAYLLLRTVSFFAEDRRSAVKPALIGLMLFWCFTPAFGQVWFWLDGACNYSLALTFIAVFLTPYFAALSGKRCSPHPALYPFICLEAFAAGAFSESGSVSALFIALCMLILILIYRRKLPPVLVLSFAAALAGFVWMMSAPSMRSGVRGALSLSAVLSVLGSLADLVGRLRGALGSALFFALILLAVALVLLLILLRRRRGLCFALAGLILLLGYCGILVLLVLPELRGHSSAMSFLYALISCSKGNVLTSCLIYFALLLAALYHRLGCRLILPSLVLFLGGVGSAAAFLFASYVPARGFLYFSFYTALGCALLCLGLAKKAPAPRLARGLSLALLAVFLLSASLALRDCLLLHRQAQERDALIAAAAADGTEELVLPVYTPLGKYNPQYGLADLPPDGSWPGNVMAQYYGFESISGADSG